MRYIRDAGKIILDFLFPPFCVACRASGAWWCADCRSRIEWPSRAVPMDGLDGLCVLGYYHDPALRAVIRALKYQRVSAVREDLKRFMQERIRRFEQKDIFSSAIQFLPAADARVRTRGFDQAEYLASILQEIIPAQIRTDILKRKKGSGIAQASLEDHALRAVNVAGAFQLKKNAEVPSRILLVDDVITSGSTMRAAADVLRANGAKKIYGFALALGK